MRLLHIPTFQLHEFHNAVPPPYAVASHRWRDAEITYQEFMSRSAEVQDKAGYRKVEAFRVAVIKLCSTLCPMLQLDYLWIDTCCIDKTNSVELQEALNSMFKWYAEAEVCLAWLHDVVSLDKNPYIARFSFSRSTWFKRGWTLQELIAPRTVLFYNNEWEIFGSKSQSEGAAWLTLRVCGMVRLETMLSTITGVPEDVLLDFSSSITKYSFEQRRSWMKNRTTTRKEDEAYCQLGLFGVFIPLIYGEGDHAMVRLEEAVELKQRRDARQRARQPESTPQARPSTWGIWASSQWDAVRLPPGSVGCRHGDSYHCRLCALG